MDVEKGLAGSKRSSVSSERSMRLFSLCGMRKLGVALQGIKPPPPPPAFMLLMLRHGDDSASVDICAECMMVAGAAAAAAPLGSEAARFQGSLLFHSLALLEKAGEQGNFCMNLIPALLPSPHPHPQESFSM